VFLRTKKSGRYEYLQLVHNQRVDGQVRQQMLASLGRVDRLRESGELDRLIASLARFSEVSAVLGPDSRTAREGAETIRIGPALLFERLWEETGIRRVLTRLVRPRRFRFDVERAVFLTVLHRLFDPGSDRAAEHWRHSYRIEGTESLELHHLYRAMAWLGKPLEADEQIDAHPFGPAPRRTGSRRSCSPSGGTCSRAWTLCSSTRPRSTSRAKGGQGLGAVRQEQGPEARPAPDDRGGGARRRRAADLQRAVAGQHHGREDACSGGGPDAEPLRARRAVHRGRPGDDQRRDDHRASARGPRLPLHPGGPDAKVKEIREIVLADPAPFEEVRGPRETSEDPAPLQVKEVRVDDRRYVVCFNPERAEGSGGPGGDPRLPGGAAPPGRQEPGRQQGLPPVPEGRRSHFDIDWEKAEDEARFDGLWVLQTDLEIDAAEVALKYKELWQVEELFRSVKSVLETRPIYHRRDDTIRGHVFCSFLALVLLDELDRRMQARGFPYEWARLRHDLDALEEIRLEVWVVRSWSAASRRVLRAGRPPGRRGRARTRRPLPRRGGEGLGVGPRKVPAEARRSANGPAGVHNSLLRRHFKIQSVEDGPNSGCQPNFSHPHSNPSVLVDER
jgi:hypothetical protein